MAASEKTAFGADLRDLDITLGRFLADQLFGMPVCVRCVRERFAVGLAVRSDSAVFDADVGPSHTDVPGLITGAFNELETSFRR